MTFITWMIIINVVTVAAVLWFNHRLTLQVRKAENELLTALRKLLAVCCFLDSHLEFNKITDSELFEAMHDAEAFLMEQYKMDMDALARKNYETRTETE